MKDVYYRRDPVVSERAAIPLPRLLYCLTALVGLSTAVLGVLLRAAGLHKGLWLDEAWVANSVLAPSWRDVFFYGPWLQTSPPGFLVLLRGVTEVFGLSNESLRILPFGMSLLAMAAMGVAAWRRLAPAHALLAWTIFVFSSTAIRRAVDVKQYSCELAVSAVLLLVCTLYAEKPNAARFRWLVLVSVAALLMAYTTVFLIPGIAAFLLLGADRAPANGTELQRAVALTLITATVFAGEYALLILPNTSPALYDFWFPQPVPDAPRLPAPEWMQPLLLRSSMARNLVIRPMVVLALALLIGAAWRTAWRDARRGLRGEFAWFVLLACPLMLLIVLEPLRIYPIDHRTILFALPWALMLVFCSLRVLERSVARRFPQAVVPMAGALLLAATATNLWAFGAFERPKLASPLEDVEQAVRYLQENSGRQDHVWVHASVAEPFKLYRAMLGWSAGQVVYGQTGWPCCPRGADRVRHQSREELVRREIESTLLLANVRTVWIIHTVRKSHWEFVGLDESEIARKTLLAADCAPGPTISLRGIGVSRFRCSLAPEAAAR